MSQALIRHHRPAISGSATSGACDETQIVATEPRTGTT